MDARRALPAFPQGVLCDCEKVLRFAHKGHGRLKIQDAFTATHDKSSTDGWENLPAPSQAL
jgi:hypothetical protein